MRISDWSSDVCSSDLPPGALTRDRIMLDVALLIERGRDLAAEGNPLPKVADDALAYVLYMSGSTGQQKGVRIRHANLTNFLSTMHNQHGCSKDDTIQIGRTQ